MSLKQNALDALVAYEAAHEAWKRAAPGPAMRIASEAKDGAHSALLAAAKLYKPQHVKASR